MVDQGHLARLIESSRAIVDKTGYVASKIAAILTCQLVYARTGKSLLSPNLGSYSFRFWRITFLPVKLKGILVN
jgi:hypothetical protein